MRRDPPPRPDARYPVDPVLLCDLIREVFEQGGVFRFYPTGISMLPMLRPHRDSVLLAAPGSRPIRRLDVILYRRADGRVVLHRVIGRDRQGDLILCGDHQWTPEPGIREDQALGMLTEFVRRGRTVRATNPIYRLYAYIWVAVRPLRGLAHRVWRRLFRSRRAK